MFTNWTFIGFGWQAMLGLLTTLQVGIRAGRLGLTGSLSLNKRTVSVPEQTPSKLKLA